LGDSGLQGIFPDQNLMVEKMVVVDMLHNPELGVSGLVVGCKLDLGSSGVFYLEPISMKVYLLREGERAMKVSLFPGLD
jgi:hypothetical protein